MFVCVAALAAFALAQKTDVVQTVYGPIMGLDFGSFRRYQGVPFAAPPLGPLRFKNPTPPGAWTSTLNCTYFNIGCAQTAHGLDVPTNKSEDCLYLEVWAPPRGKYASPASVMIFWHGGDFKEGGESMPLYDGSYMSSTSNTMLVVSNYRLGALGFLYSSYNDANLGIQDQRFALEWIQSNAAAFGADASNVTIFGESAGGESIWIHLANPNVSAADMFHRGIVESGPVLSLKTETDALELAASFVGLLNCVLGDLACLQSKNITEILQAADHAIIIPNGAGEAVMKWAPVVDGVTIEQQPLKAFETGNMVKKPFIVGSNKDDGVLFAFLIAGGNKGHLVAIEYIAIVAGIFQDKYIVDILLHYPPVWTGDNRYVLADLLTDYMFFCSGRHMLRCAEKAGVQQIYQYQFTHQPPFHVWPPSQQFCNSYVCHGDEIPYVFRDTGGIFPWNMTTVDLWLANATSSFWTTFAATSAPGGAWRPYAASSDASMNLDWPPTMKSAVKPVCDFFDKVGYQHSHEFWKLAAKAAAELRKK